MSASTRSSYIVRAIVVNAFLLAGFIQAERTGKATIGIVALYAFMAVLANTFMFFGARARRKFQGD